MQSDAHPRRLWPDRYVAARDHADRGEDKIGKAEWRDVMDSRCDAAEAGAIAATLSQA
jgi:hypothetical protein